MMQKAFFDEKSLIFLDKIKLDTQKKKRLIKDKKLFKIQK